MLGRIRFKLAHIGIMYLTLLKQPSCSHSPMVSNVNKNMASRGGGKALALTMGKAVSAKKVTTAVSFDKTYFYDNTTSPKKHTKGRFNHQCPVSPPAATMLRALRMRQPRLATHKNTDRRWTRRNTRRTRLDIWWCFMYMTT